MLPNMNQPARSLATFTLASFLASSAAAMGPQNIMFRLDRPQQGSAKATSVGFSGPHLDYYGGPVMASVHAYAVYWGGSVDASVQGRMPTLLGAFTASPLFDWLAEYDTTINDVDGLPGTGQHITRGTFVGAITLTPQNTSSQLSDGDVQTELAAQVAAGHLPQPDANTLFLVFFPHGIVIKMNGDASCQVFCAYHGSFKLSGRPNLRYVIVPDMAAGSGCENGCGHGSMLDNVGAAASHELVEAVTDPDVALSTTNGPPLGWYDASTGSAADPRGEIGDICNGMATPLTTAAGTFTVQKEWSNQDSACKGVVTDDFTLTIDPPTATLDASKSQSATFTIHTVTTKGSPGLIKLGQIGAASGVSVTFAAAAVSGGASTTVTVSTTPSSVNGTAEMGILGDTAQITRRVPLPVTVIGGSSAPPGGGIVPVIINIAGGCNGVGPSFAWAAALLLMAARRFNRRNRYADAP